MPVRGATEDDLDEICALIRELAEYERMTDAVEFDVEQLRSMTDGRVEWAVPDWNEPSIRFYQSLGAGPVEGWTTYRWLRPETSKERAR
jgi:hypothetical protein